MKQSIMTFLSEKSALIGLSEPRCILYHSEGHYFAVMTGWMYIIQLTACKIYK